MIAIRTLVLAFLATCAITALTTATAIAHESEIVNKEGKTLLKNKFTGSSGETKIETAEGTKIVCKSDTVSGAMTSVTGGEETVTMKECTSAGLKCRNVSSPETSSGELKVFLALKAAVASETKALLLTSISESRYAGGVYELECAGVKITLRGSFLISLSEEQESKYKTSETFATKETKGKQEPSEYENAKGEKAKDTLEVSVSGKADEAAGISTEEKTTFEEGLLIKPSRVELLHGEPLFGSIVKNTSKTESFTFINATAVTYTGINITLINGAANPFTIPSNLCTGAKAASSMCVVEIQFKPTAVEGYVAVVELIYEEGGERFIKRLAIGGSGLV